MVNVGIIGLGKMGTLHAAQISTIPDAKLIALADTDKALLKQAKGSGIDVPFFTDVQEMLETVDIDAVFICTPAFTHFPIAEMCANYGLHMFVEKPLAESLQSAQKMMQLVDSNKIIVHQVGFSFAFHPVFRKAKELIDKGIIGNIFRFRSSTYISVVFRKQSGWIYQKNKSGGGIVINSASHLVHLLWWFFGDIKGVFARTLNLYSDVEDCGCVFFEFTNEVTGIMDTSWSIPGYRLQEIRIVIEATNGLMEITNDEIKLYLNKSADEFSSGWTTLHRIDLDDSSQFFLGSEEFNSEDEHFIRCCIDKSPTLISWVDGFKVQQIIDVIYHSAEVREFIEVEEDE